MYGEEFGTDWESLDRKEILNRAYALGVAAALGRHYEGEFERLERAADTNYDWSLVELAYSEGKTKALNLDPENTEDEQVWDQLVAERDGVSRPEPPERGDGPPDLVDRPAPDSRPDDGLDRLRLPEFLRRE
jgi:hypothetical protein